MTLMEAVADLMAEAVINRIDLQLEHLNDHVQRVIGCVFCNDRWLTQQLEVAEQPHFHLCCLL